MKIIAFGHKKQVGKDLAASLLYRNIACDRPELKVEITAFAEPLYHIAHYLYGWAGFKSKKYYDKFPHTKGQPIERLGLTPRELLIRLGTNAIRKEVYEYTWIDHVLERERSCDLLLITDLRFPNEYDRVKEMGGCCVEIDRPGVTADDEADTALDNWSWDFVIRNDGTKRELNDALWNTLGGLI